MAIVRPTRSASAMLVERFRSHRMAKPASGPRWFGGFRPPLPLAPDKTLSALAPTRLRQPLGRIGSLELKLADSSKEVKRAQRLRYEVFYKEMSAIADPIARLARRDMDAYDAVCDHLLVLDRTEAAGVGARLAGFQGFDLKGFDMSRLAGAGAGGFAPHKPRVVGTYRLLRQQVADSAFGFYSSGEFAIDDLIARHPALNFLELGRSCVLKPYRDKRTVELLWQGIWAYVLAHDIDVMIGCASLEGVDPRTLAQPLSYLHHFHAAPPEWRAPALPDRAVSMNLLPREAVEPRAALKGLPPLIKAYLRLGAFIGDGAVVDRQFGTTDVLIVLPRALINPRYVAYYGAEPAPRAA